jgi:hypothetical protein
LSETIFDRLFGVTCCESLCKTDKTELTFG